MFPKEQQKLLRFASASFALIVALISAAVLALWHLKTAEFVANHYWIFDMQHTAALLFLLCSVGLIVAASGHKRAVAVLGGFVSLVAGVILLEYITGHDFGIDQLLLVDDVHADATHPGRLAPNTALAFLFTGLSLILVRYVFRQSPHFCFAVADLTGFAVFALGAHAIGGYLGSFEQAYAWVTDTRMAIHTAVSNMCMGISLLTLSWASQDRKIALFPLWIPFVICFVALQITLVSPPGIVTSVIYIPLILSSLWFTNPLTVFVFALIATFFVTLRYFLLPLEMMTEEILVNRVLTTFVIWFVAVLIYWKRNFDLKLLRSEQYLQAIVENTMEGLIVVNHKGIICKTNPACNRIFGYEDNELIGQSVNVLMLSPYCENHDQYIDNYLKTGVRKVIGSGREVAGLRKDGSEFPMEIGVCEMKIEEERFFSGILRDITVRKLAEEELLRSNTELERFAYVAAHDLQEPLRIIIKSMEFLHEDFGETIGEGGQRYVDNSSKAAKRMRALIGDLLEYSRLGKQSHRFKKIPVRECLDVALENLHEVIQSHNAEIVIEGDFPEIDGSSVQVVRLFQNLIGNGLKYCQKDLTPQIRISVEDHDGVAVFCVEDNGIGIDEKYIEQIFIPFKRLHTVQAYPGSGIGLSVCKRIVEMHHGKLWVQSEVGRGSRFFFTLDVEHS
ncbi:MAG: PAS domain S-box protein [Alphaproteobacteria bacterium]|nr:PAS domain S-box protein [Alphaproteobacteria bacterium]